MQSRHEDRTGSRRNTSLLRLRPAFLLLGTLILAFVTAVAVSCGGAGETTSTSSISPESTSSATTATTQPAATSSSTTADTTTSSSQPTSSTQTPTTAAPAGRQVGVIVYLEGKGLPKGTMETLKALHATEVYLYVAYYSDAYYSIPQNPYGLAQPADSLGPALQQLHDAGYRVIGVISTALLDWRQAPQEGLGILQHPDKPIFDPVKAGPFVEQLTQSLVTYPLDGIYVGEPYWLDSTGDQARKLEWNKLYERLFTITQKAGMPFHMIMPTFNGIFTLHPTFSDLPFQTIGMDAEFAYYTQDRQTNLDYFNRLIGMTQDQAKGGKEPLIEVSLRKGMSTSPAPPDFFAEELKIARESGMKRVIVFAATFWESTPNKDRYSAALEQFLAP